MRDFKENPRGLKNKHIWTHTWTVTDAWHTTELLTQMHQSLKLSTADNWSETGFTHISNTHTLTPPVTTLTFDLRWRRLLSDGVDPFSVCEIISCQCHCEGQKGAKLQNWVPEVRDINRQRSTIFCNNVQICVLVLVPWKTLTYIKPNTDTLGQQHLNDFIMQSVTKASFILLTMLRWNSVISILFTNLSLTLYLL